MQSKPGEKGQCHIKVASNMVKFEIIWLSCFILLELTWDPVNTNQASDTWGMGDLIPQAHLTDTGSVNTLVLWVPLEAQPLHTYNALSESNTILL